MSTANRDIINIAGAAYPMLTGTYVKLNAFNRMMCYQRGGLEDREIRRTLGPIMIEFPNGNEYVCITYDQAVSLASASVERGHLYGMETLSILRRMYSEYWKGPAAPALRADTDGAYVAGHGYTTINGRSAIHPGND